ncbi:MAG: rhomboid family intramembrane serine protease [Candidatus Kapaibacterium sp.]
MGMYDRDYSSPRRGFSFFPPVLKSLLIINVAVFIVDAFFLEMYSLGGKSLAQFFSDFFALQPLQSGEFYPWQLITYQFMHGGFSHIFFNLFALWMFGADLENLWGSRRFLAFYLLCGIGAGLVQLGVQFVPGVNPATTVGASGAIFGVLLAFGLTFPDRPIIMFPIFFPIPAKFFVLIYAGIDLFSGLTNVNSGVAHFAHLGGAIFGFILLKFGDQLRIFDGVDRVLNLFSSNKQAIPRRPASPLRRVDVPRPSTPMASPSVGRGSGMYVEGQEISQRQIDTILDKISSTGFNSLSDEEKKILYEISKKMD